MKEEKSPEELLFSLKKGEIDKAIFSESLYSLIESIEDKEIRIESIKKLNDIELEDNERFYKLLESLVISDSDEEVRRISIKLLIESYSDRSLKTLEWVIMNDRSSRCLSTVLEKLNSDKNDQLHEIIIKEIKEIVNRTAIKGAIIAPNLAM